MDNSKKGNHPMRHGITLSRCDCPTNNDEEKRMSDVTRASAIGSIMYAILSTRPDISYALSVTSHYQSCPSENQWTLVKVILKYLRRAKDMFLVYGGDNGLLVEDYTDARSKPIETIFDLNPSTSLKDMLEWS
ncbi:hypothetical protein LIER_10265 [Lithospermum erythrorhizon]|uniref:Retrotransposon protein n=1 Tax=Lithospermum erythrorhizon TaxID=34254 RepID=A0AAV3PIT2_LITER